MATWYCANKFNIAVDFVTMMKKLDAIHEFERILVLCPTCDTRNVTSSTDYSCLWACTLSFSFTPFLPVLKICLSVVKRLVLRIKGGSSYRTSTCMIPTCKPFPYILERLWSFSSGSSSPASIWSWCIRLTACIKRGSCGWHGNFLLFLSQTWISRLLVR